MVGTSIAFDTVIDLCRHRNRRLVLAALEDRQRPATMDDLVDVILEQSHHTSRTETADDTVTQVETALHHLHLPKIAEAGLVTYDTERRRIEPTAQFDQGVAFLSAILDADPALETQLVDESV